MFDDFKSYLLAFVLARGYRACNLMSVYYIYISVDVYIKQHKYNQAYL